MSITATSALPTVHNDVSKFTQPKPLAPNTKKILLTPRGSPVIQRALIRMQRPRDNFSIHRSIHDLKQTNCQTVTCHQSRRDRLKNRTGVGGNVLASPKFTDTKHECLGHMRNIFIFLCFIYNACAASLIRDDPAGVWQTICVHVNVCVDDT